MDKHIKKIVGLVSFIAILAYREWQILVDRGSWLVDNTWLKFWYTDWKSWLKDLDSFHFMNGLSVLVLLETFTDKDDILINFNPEWLCVQAHVVFYWLAWMYIRNIFMHIVFDKKPQWKYLIPIKFIRDLIWK